MKVLLAGGAGYIGSHTAISLIQNGHDIVIVDNLYNSSVEVIKRLETICSQQIPFETEWLSATERSEIFAAVERFAQYQDTNPHALLAVEQPFDVSLEVDGQEVVLRGTVDRLERTADGRLRVVDLKTGRMSVVNAGHNPPLIRRRGEGFAYLKTVRGPMLAASKRKSYQQEEVMLQPGDELFLYTDGVTEATNAHSELYGEARLQQLLNTLGELPMEEGCARVKADVDAFVGDAPQFDDMTMLGFRYRGGDGVEGTDAGSND